MEKVLFEKIKGHTSNTEDTSSLMEMLAELNCKHLCNYSIKRPMQPLANEILQAILEGPETFTLFNKF